MAARWHLRLYYSDVIMDAMASQITSLAIVCSTVYSGIDQRKHQSSASLAFVRGIHRWPVNSPHKGRVTWKRFLMTSSYVEWILLDPTSVQSSLWLDPCYMRAMKNGNVSMMTSSNGKKFPRYWPFVTGHRWISLANASDAENWCFLWSASE